MKPDNRELSKWGGSLDLGGPEEEQTEGGQKIQTRRRNANWKPQLGSTDVAQAWNKHNIGRNYGLDSSAT